MDQLPRSNEGFANNNLYADSQQYNAYNNLLYPGADQNSYDASWGVNASNYPVQSRAPQHQPAPSWQQNANQLPAPSAQANINGRASPYARSLSHSPAGYGQNAFNGYGAPQGFQYRQPQYDPSLVSPHFNQNFNYPITDYQTPNSGTIAPHALQHEPRAPSFNHNPYDTSPYQVSNYGPPRQNRTLAPEFVDQGQLISAIPTGKNGGRFSIINFDELSKATSSERMGNFLNVGVDAHNWDVNRAALPVYAPRKSRNELRKAASNDPKLLAKLGKKTLKKERAFAAVPKPTQASTKGPVLGADKIKYDADQASDDSSSSDEEDDSSYSSEDEGPSPLPDKRPETLKGGTEYDTIQALWRGKRKNLDSATIRKGLGEFWEIVKTIRDRWKLDVAAFQDAESKGRKNELPLLESRVKDQRDMLETAFKAALKHGHRGILELMSENVALLFLCYQFLLDRFKVEDYNGALPRTILETMSLFSTMTNDKLEKTHMVKVLPRFIKKGDAKTQFYAKRITANAASGSKESPAEDSTKRSTTKETSAASPTGKREPEPVAGVKRSATTAADGGVQKKVAVGASKANGVLAAAKASAPTKKPGLPADNAKSTAATTAPAAKPKQVVAKPSGLFSSLQSAAKKPGTATTNKAVAPTASIIGSKSTAEKSSIGSAVTNQNAAPASTFSFAETMANLSKTKEEKPAAKPEKQTPPETPEEKAKRLRKESRRHLHVSFKTGDELVQIHEFHHDPEEELGHDASQVRDLADVGGEGRMFKQQHQMMEVDEEEDSAEEDDKLVDFVEPTPIDFSVVDVEERKRNYQPYGGGKLEIESSERSVREKYENDTLIVSYIDSSDVPPNPREPSDPYNGAAVDSVKKFGMPEEKWMARGRQGKIRSPQYQKTPQPAMQTNPAPSFDLSKLTNFTSSSQMPQANVYQPPSQPPAPSNDAINNILASLKQAQPNQATPPLPMMTGYGSGFSAPPPNMNSFPPQQPTQPPAGQPDLAAILAQIQQVPPAGPPQPSMGGFGFNNTGAVPNMTGYPPQAQQSGIYENPERKQWRDGGGAGDNKLRKKTPSENPYYRTKVCKYWQEGRCQKGDQCSYKHSES